MFVTRHHGVTDRRVRDQLWSLFAIATGTSPSTGRNRHLRAEVERAVFDEELIEPTNRVWVVWADTAPIAAAMIETTAGPGGLPVRGDVVHRLRWVVVHPAHLGSGALVRLARDAFAAEAADGAQLVFDASDGAAVPIATDDATAVELVRRLAATAAPGTTVVATGIEHTWVADFVGARRAADRAADRAGQDDQADQPDQPGQV